jgi:hypothetical protein
LEQRVADLYAPRIDVAVPLNSLKGGSKIVRWKMRQAESAIS